jgi:hypothetical protein
VVAIERNKRVYVKVRAFSRDTKDIEGKIQGNSALAMLRAFNNNNKAANWDACSCHSGRRHAASDG